MKGFARRMSARVTSVVTGSRIRIQRGMGRRSALSAAVMAAVILLAPLGQVGHAQAATGNVGRYEPNDASCERNTILVLSPQMLQAPGGFGGGQWARFRPHLTQWFPGAGWRTIASGIWKKTVVGDTPLGVANWTTLAGQPVAGGHRFTIPREGTWNNPIYYRVFTEYYWYPDQYRTSGYDSSWNPHRELRGNAYDLGAYEWCKYPGPNWLTMN